MLSNGSQFNSTQRGTLRMKKNSGHPRVHFPVYTKNIFGLLFIENRQKKDDNRLRSRVGNPLYVILVRPTFNFNNTFRNVDHEIVLIQAYLSRSIKSSTLLSKKANNILDESLHEC